MQTALRRDFMKKALGFLLGALQFLMFHLPISITALIGLFFGIKIFLKPDLNTISLTSSAFAIMAAFAALSFGYSRTLPADDVIKKRVQYCGERFLHSAILFIVSSIIKYFIIQDDIAVYLDRYVWINFLLRIIIIVFYFSSLVNAIAALRELNAIMYERKKPGEELSRFI